MWRSDVDWELHGGNRTGMELGYLHGKMLVKIGLALKEHFKEGRSIHLNFLLIILRLRVLLGLCICVDSKDNPCLRDWVLFCDTSPEAQTFSATQSRVFVAAPCPDAVNSTSVFIECGVSEDTSLQWDHLHPQSSPGTPIPVCFVEPARSQHGLGWN